MEEEINAPRGARVAVPCDVRADSGMFTDLPQL